MVSMAVTLEGVKRKLRAVAPIGKSILASESATPGRTRSSKGASSGAPGKRLRLIRSQLQSSQRPCRAQR